MESIPAVILALWEAHAYNEMYPDREKKTVLLTSSDWDILEEYNRSAKKTRNDSIAFKPALIKDVKSTTLHF